MRINRKYSLVILLLLQVSATVAQDAKTDFGEIGRAYANLKSASIEMQYMLFPNHNTDKAQEEKTGMTIVYKHLYYKKFDGVEIFRDGSIAVVADRPKKLLILQPVKIRKKDKLLPVDIDSELKSYQSVTYKKINDRLSRYTLNLKNGKIEKLILEFDPVSYLIENITIFYKDPMPESGQDKTPPRVEIKYTYHQLSDKEKKGLSVKKYFTVVRGKYLPNEPYDKYEFVNRMHK